jgi:NAD(P)-dependent dehydrogenase (short-subunit alcohol dehydrogenase family)
MKEHRKEPSQSGVLIVGVGASRGLGAAIARRFASGATP